ncbi:PEP-CTERM sorting domain-containing protein [Puniceicoccaceae bacterium]|nr:PEP-CTERM sorting domain-containing protein [Puniceicoccaceae bacterium]
MKIPSKAFAVCAVGLSTIAGSSLQAQIVLNLPGAGESPSGTVVSTSSSLAGATFDIEYTVNAFAADETNVDAFIRSFGGTYFGVGSEADGTTNGQKESVDANDGEQISITGLSITNFNTGTSGLTSGDFTISFNTLTITNGTAANDGVDISFIGFGNTIANQNPVTTVALTSLSNYSSTATSLFLEPDGSQSNNRWSVSGLSVSVVPEPSSFALLAGCFGLATIMLRRRKA